MVSTKSQRMKHRQICFIVYCNVNRIDTLGSQQRFEDAIQRCLEVKKANQAGQVSVSKRIISEDELKEKFKAGV